MYGVAGLVASKYFIPTVLTNYGSVSAYCDNLYCLVASMYERISPIQEEDTTRILVCAVMFIIMRL